MRFLLVLLLAASASAQEPMREVAPLPLPPLLGAERGTGLEAEPPGMIGVLVEYPNTPLQEVGVTEEKIEHWVASYFHGRGYSTEAPYPDRNDWYLYVNVGASGNAYAVDLEVIRPVIYYAGGVSYRTQGSVWRKGVIGQPLLEIRVRDAVYDVLGEFLEEYRLVNR